MRRGLEDNEKNVKNKSNDLPLPKDIQFFK